MFTKASKIFLFAAAILLGGSTSRAAAVAESLFLNLKDNRTIEFRLASKPRLSFDGNELVIASENASLLSYPMADIANIDFGTTSSAEGQECTLTFVAGPSGITVDGLPAGGVLNIYDVQGRLVRQEAADGAGHAAADTSELPAGTYIVAAAGTKWKIMKH